MIDTRNKRASVLGTLGPWMRFGTGPLADGTLANKADRRHMAGFYAGILTEAPVEATMPTVVGSYITHSTGQTDTTTLANVTVASGQQLIVMPWHYGDNTVEVESLTFHGDALTFVDHSNKVYLYTMPTPDVGTFDIVLTLNRARWNGLVAFVVEDWSGIFREFSGVVAANDMMAQNIGVSPLSLTFASNPNDLTLSLVHNGFPLQSVGAFSFVTGAGQTELENESPFPGNALIGAASSKSGALSTTHSYSITGSMLGSLIITAISLRAPDEPEPEEGEVPTGINPPPSLPPGTTPQVFMVLSEPSDGEIIDTQGETDGGPFCDREAWFGGYKEARILEVSTIRRAYTTVVGGIQGTHYTIRFNDRDRYYRSLFGVQTLRGLKNEVFVIEHNPRLAEDEPYRMAAGLVSEHGAVDDLEYEIQVEGGLGRHSAKKLREKKVPGLALDVPILAEKFKAGWYPPIGYGQLSDEMYFAPQGVCGGEYVGSGNAATLFGGNNLELDFYVFFGHAVQNTLNLYTNAPDETQARVLVDASEYGNRVWAPHKPNWTEVIPGGEDYVDYTVGSVTWRLTVVAVLASDPLAESLRLGRSILAGNFNAIEDIGDATGKLIESPPRIFQHFWENFVETSYQGGNWSTGIKSFGDYSLIEYQRVEDAHQFNLTLMTGGTKGALIIGNKGKQEALSDILKTMSFNWDLEFCENRHGQICADYENPAAAPIVKLTQQHDWMKFRATIDRQAYANTIRYRYGFLYVEPVAPHATPPAGEALPKKNLPEFDPWISNLIVVPYSAEALTVNKEEPVYLDVDFYAVRDPDSVDVLRQRILKRAVGTSGSQLSLEGPVNVEGQTGWQGAGIGSTVIDLNTVCEVDHIEGLEAPGFVGSRVRVKEQTWNVLKGICTLVCRWLPEL